jgi:hypothetical protein
VASFVASIYSVGKGDVSRDVVERNTKKRMPVDMLLLFGVYPGDAIFSGAGAMHGWVVSVFHCQGVWCCQMTYVITFGRTHY